MTGTPVETSLLDLWSLADIAIPDLLGSRESFEDDFPDSEDSARSLARLTDPIILCRKREDLVYDANGNRTLVERRANAADVSAAQTDNYVRSAGTNRLASITAVAGTRSIAYDARGNTLSETRPSAVTVATSYDGHGRLLSYTRTGEASQANVYNGLDERVTVTSGSTVRRFVYDPGGRVLGEYGTAASNVIAERIWMTPEVNSARLFGGDDGTGGYAPIAIVAGTTLSWVHGNHLGVPQVYTSSAGAVIATPAYTLPGFPGQFRTTADFYYNKYRDYDISTGRYIQADPIGLSGGTSPYLYANGNPVRYTDSSGLFLDTLLDVGFIGYDLNQIFNDNFLGNGKGNSLGTNLTALGLDVTGAAVPGITGLGPASRAARGGDDVIDAAKGFKGSRGPKGLELSQPDYQRVRNSPGEVNGLPYSGHTFDQMQNRGIMPPVVEHAIKVGKQSPDQCAGRS